MRRLPSFYFLGMLFIYGSRVYNRSGKGMVQLKKKKKINRCAGPCREVCVGVQRHLAEGTDNIMHLPTWAGRTRGNRCP